MSAFGGKADIIHYCSKGPLIAKSGHLQSILRLFTWRHVGRDAVNKWLYTGLLTQDNSRVPS